MFVWDEETWKDWGLSARLGGEETWGCPLRCGIASQLRGAKFGGGGRGEVQEAVAILRAPNPNFETSTSGKPTGREFRLVCMRQFPSAVRWSV